MESFFKAVPSIVGFSFYSREERLKFVGRTPIKLSAQSWKESGMITLFVVKSETPTH